MFPYLVQWARFGMLLALALWMGTAIGLMLTTPVLFKRLERDQAGDIAGLMLGRADRFFLFFCIPLLAAGVGFRIVSDGSAPPLTFAALVGGMALSRLIAALAVAPGIRALRPRLRDANAPATDAEKAAFRRLHGASMLLMTLEIVLGGYALFVLS